MVRRWREWHELAAALAAGVIDHAPEADLASRSSEARPPGQGGPRLTMVSGRGLTERRPARWQNDERSTRSGWVGADQHRLRKLCRTFTRRWHAVDAQVVGGARVSAGPPQTTTDDGRR